MEEEGFTIFASKMNLRDTSEDRIIAVPSFQLLGPYNVQIKTIMEKLNLLDKDFDKKINSKLFNQLNELFNLEEEINLPKHCNKIRNVYRFTRTIKNKKHHSRSSCDLQEAIENYFKFCEKNNLKPDL